jgi:hypothetical protein
MDSIPNGTPLTGKLSARNWPAQFGGRGSAKPALPTPINPGLEVLRRGSGEAMARLPTCPRRWAERAAAGEGPTARLFGAPTWVGGVNQDSGK